MKILKYKILLVLMIGMILEVDAQFQRMGIKRGTRLTILGNAKGKIPTYCMDYTLKAPTSGTSYKKILSNPGSAKVKFGSEVPKSLQSAIDAGEIIIEGVSMTFESIIKNLEDLMNSLRLSVSERQEIESIKLLWNQLSEAEKRALNRELFIQYGDHTQMQLINKTNKTATISFNENSVLGVDKNTNIGSINTSLLNNNSQSNLWTSGNKEAQRKLKELGYYKGEIDGKFGPNSIIAIKRFQRKNNLNPTGLIDSTTDQLLLASYNRKIEKNKRLQEFLRKNGEYNGKTDGIIGKKSNESISSFKRKHGLEKYDLEMTAGKEKAEIKFKNQREFIDYFKKLDEECNPELCISDGMSISLSNNCIPASFSVSVSEGLKITLEAGGISYDIPIIDINQQDSDGCQLKRTACFSKTSSKDYSIQCNKGEKSIEVNATQASLSFGNLSVSIFN
jgi:peptidoglycan hydrolase-like protein with peptidoglycan-binding domain